MPIYDSSILCFGQKLMIFEAPKYTKTNFSRPAGALLRPGPAGGSLQRFPRLCLAGGEGALAAAFPTTPTPALGPLGLVLRPFLETAPMLLNTILTTVEYTVNVIEHVYAYLC